MSTSESIHALRRANPRARAGFPSSVEAIAGTVRAQVASVEGPAPRPVRRSARRRVVGVSAVGASLAAVAAVVAALTVGSTSGGPAGVESAEAAVRKAARVSAASAERSGTALVRMTHGGKKWVETTIRWNGGNLLVSHGEGRRGRAGSQMLLVDGLLYGVEPDRGWVIMGTPANIDPDSGTTPGEYLAAVRLDVGGATLRRITGGMTGLTTSRVGGDTIYSGTVKAGLIARETGFKDGKEIRVLPFGFVANDEAADPAARVDAALKVGPDGLVREVEVSWGTGASAWTYSVAYTQLGSTASPVAPANARPLRDRSGKSR
jgi:hypothetical protein